MSLEHVPRKFLRRKAAAAYLKENYGFGATATLAKLASVGGGPEMTYAGPIPLYTPNGLDTWAESRLSAPVRSTSERRRPAPAGAAPVRTNIVPTPDAISSADDQGRDHRIALPHGEPRAQRGRGVGAAIAPFSNSTCEPSMRIFKPDSSSAVVRRGMKREHPT